jgi:UDPglucose--hexose-1-phosphate uridylyltransferase
VTHRRFDPLSGRWVTLSDGRLARPWHGEETLAQAARLPEHDAACFLCPGNVRANGAINPAYTGPWLFDNDFPALADDSDDHADAAATTAPQPHSLFAAMPVRGRCQVLCYSPRHDLALHQLTDADLEAVVQVWRQQTVSLGRSFAWVQIFENRGDMMGASSPHPHGQIWSTTHLPDAVATEDLRQQAFHDENGQPMLVDYVTEELRRGERIVSANADWVVLVPWWAVWPFETLLLPREPLPWLGDLDDGRAGTLAAMLRDLIGRYDRLFGVRFPYSMGWHGRAVPHWTLHAHFLPPLLRSATVRKHMVGYELLAEAQRDLSPEAAAARLRGA